MLLPSAVVKTDKLLASSIYFCLILITVVVEVVLNVLCANIFFVVFLFFLKSSWDGFEIRLILGSVWASSFEEGR